MVISMQKNVFFLLTLLLGSIAAPALELNSGWSNATPQISSSTPVGPDGFTVEVTAVNPFHTANEWFMPRPLDRREQEFSGEIAAPSQGVAYLAVKLYKDGKELKRLESSRNQGKRLALRFSPGDADKIQLLCRVEASERTRGQKIRFGKLRLQPILPPPPPADCRPGKLNPAHFRNFSTNTTAREEADRLSVTIDSPARFDSTLALPLREIPPHRDMVFAAEVQSTQTGIGYLAIKLYKGTREIKRLESPSAGRREQTLRLAFNTADADKIELLLRVQQTPAQVGAKVTFGNLRLEECGSSAPPSAQSLRLIPGYQNCSVELSGLEAANSKTFQSSMRFRPAGEKAWQSAPIPVYLPDEKNARASLLKLRENTRYEVEITADDAGTARTWHEEFTTLDADLPVARTIELGPENFSGQLVIRESGTPQGYIRYTAKPGFVLQGAPGIRSVITVEDAAYILLDGLTIRGGTRFGLNLVHAENVAVRNCDIADFGELGTPVLKAGYKYQLNGEYLTDIAGIRIYDSGNLLIERNYIHDSRAKTCPWFYSHPDGAFGMLIRANARVTIRHNDIVGSDDFRWNDAIGGYNNGDLFGGPARDAEIYGNYLAFGNDDGIELDGGQRNTRFYHNKVEGMLCAVSTAPCMEGPSYVFENLFCNPGDEFQTANLAFKNCYQQYGKGRLHFYHNTAIGGWSGYSGYYSVPVKLSHPDELKTVGRNNLLSITAPFVNEAVFQLPVDLDYDLLYAPGQTAKESPQILAEQQQQRHAITAAPQFLDAANADYRLRPGSPGEKAGTAIPGLTPAGSNLGAFHAAAPVLLPERPLPLYPNQQQLNFRFDGPNTAKLTLTGSYAGNFTIRQNHSSDFFAVTPARGVIRPGETVELTVTLRPKKMPNARLYTAAFMIVAANGYSRPVTVRADYQSDAARLARDRRQVIFGSVSPQDAAGNCSFEFELSTPGYYYLFAFTDPVPWAVHLKKDGVDGEFRRTSFYGRQGATGGSWCALSPNFYGWQPHLPQFFASGKHRYTVQQRKHFRYRFDQVALAATPEELLRAPGAK